MKKESSRQKNSTVFEGMTSIRAVLSSMESSNGRSITAVYFDSAKKASRKRELSFLSAMSKKYGFDIIETDGEKIEKMTVGTTHGGIIAECTDREFPVLEEKLIEPSGFYVLIDGIEDPYNFGYAVRSIYASGASGLVLPERNWMSAAGVVCRSSAGASERIPIFSCDPETACDIFKRCGYKVVCSGINDSVSVYDCEMKKPVLLIVGGEKRGISRSLLAKADLTVRIDYGREFKESLSTASAATILSYEIYRQNRRCKTDKKI